MSHKLSRSDETQGENFKWRDGAMGEERRWDSRAEKKKKTPAAHFHSEAQLCLSYLLPPTSTQAATSHYLQGQLLLIIFLVKPERRGRWKFRRWAPQTPSHQRIKADVLWWSNTMLLWYCSAQRSGGPWLDDKVWSHFSNDTFAPFPLKVPPCAASTMHLFMGWCFPRAGCCALLTSPSWWSSWNAQAWEFVKLAVFVDF